MSQGRGNLALMEKSVKDLAQADYLKVEPTETIDKVITQLTKERKTEAYCVANDGKYIGKLFLPQLLKSKSNSKAQKNLLASEKIIPANASLFHAIEVASDFVGEGMAVIDQETGKILGIVSEADLFSAYLEEQKKINKLEHG